MRKLIRINIIILLFVSCKKETDNEPLEQINDIPYIEIRSVSASTVTEYQDSIIFEVFYQDGDGDLGFASPDSFSLFITDSRIFTVEDYYLPLLSVEGSNQTIQGILNVKLDRTIMIDDSNASEEVQFKIQVKDRAGHYSNFATSQVITVLPD